MKHDSTTYFLRRGICPVCKSKMNKESVLDWMSHSYRTHFDCETCESLFLGSRGTGILIQKYNNFFVLYEENEDNSITLYKRFSGGWNGLDFVSRFKRTNDVLVDKIKLINYYYNKGIMYYRFDGQHSFRKCVDKSFKTMFEDRVIHTRRDFEDGVLTYVDKVLSYRYNKTLDNMDNYPISVFREFEEDATKIEFLKNNLHIDKFIDLLCKRDFYVRRYNKQNFIKLFRKVFRGEEDDENKSIVV